MTNILRLSVPLTLWLVGFSALYALQGLACSRHWPEALEPRPVLIAASAVAVGVQALVLLALHSRPSPSRFAQGVATALGVAALVAAAWTALPILAVTVCAG